MRADTGIQPDAFDNGLGVQAFHFGISVQFVEEGNTEGQVSVGKKLHGLRLSGSHKQYRHILLDSPLLDDGGKGVSGFFQRSGKLVFRKALRKIIFC